MDTNTLGTNTNTGAIYPVVNNGSDDTIHLTPFEKFSQSVLDLLSNLAVLELREESENEDDEHEQERALVFKYLLEEFREYTIDRGKTKERVVHCEWDTT
jgi:hypothetical protein